MAKGGKQPGAGRPKGTANKSTLEFKEAVNKLIDFATPQMVGWLDAIARDDPNKALDHVYKFAQFGFPLLSRADSTVTGKEGGAIEHNLTVRFVE